MANDGVIGGNNSADASGVVEKHLRELPDAIELSDKQYGKIVKSADAEKEVARPEWWRQIAEKHNEILDMLKNGVTVRVIHTKVGFSRAKVWQYIHETEDLLDAYNDAQEDMLDLSEEVVNEIATMDCEMESTENGNFPRYDGRSLATKFNAAKFRLERLGAKRGWGAKLETNEVGNGGNKTPVIFMGQFTEEMIAESEAEVKRANEEAVKGLEGIVNG